MKEALTHIMDESVCLTRRQLRDYLSGGMLPIEAHAVEVHLASCPLCSMAVDGFEEHPEGALQAIGALNSGFLKTHFDKIAPQIHLNSIAPAMATSAMRPRKGAGIPVWRIAAVAASALLAVGIFWLVDQYRNAAMRTKPHALSMAEQNVAPAAPPAMSTTVHSDAPATHDGTVKATPGAASKMSLAYSDQTASRKPGHTAKPPEPAGTGSLMAAQFRPKAKAKMIADTPLPAAALRSRDNGSQERTEEAAPVLVQTTDQAVPDRPLEGAGRTSESPAKRAVNRSKSVQPPTSEAGETNEASAGGALDRGKAAFSAGKYTKALRFFQQQMNTGDAGLRQKATIMAARCYAALGNSTKAQELLQSAADGSNSRQRRAARRELRKMK